MSDNDHETVTPSDYKRRDLNSLLSYINKEKGATLKDRNGREMTGRDVQDLIDKSEDHEMSRHIIISTENGEELDRDDLDHVAKQTLRDTLGNRETVDYAYGVHEDGGDRAHIHVAATGRADNPGDPLWLDTPDLHEMADVAHDRSKQRERSITKNLQKAKTAGLARGK